jgi:hypothetical protein
MIHYFYYLDYDILPRGSQMDTSTWPCPHLTTHAKVYSLGEKYLIGGLKAVALQKFDAAAKAHWDITDFLGAAKEAYTSSAGTDRGLKDAIISIVSGRSELLDEEEVQNAFQELDMLAYDLLMLLRQKRRF